LKERKKEGRKEGRKGRKKERKKNSSALMNSLNGSQGSPRLHGSHFEHCCSRRYNGNLQVIQNSSIGSSPLFFFTVYISFLLFLSLAFPA